MTMSQAINNPASVEQEKQDWIKRVEQLARQVSGWARDAGWEVHGATKTIQERTLGEYAVPHLTIKRDGGELFLDPIARHTLNRRSQGRVDLGAYPTLSRVMLLGSDEGWTIMTDSNVPLREPWSPETFRRLADDLLGDE
jgi:hypothetical protein